MITEINIIKPSAVIIITSTAPSSVRTDEKRKEGPGISITTASGLIVIVKIPVRNCQWWRGGVTTLIPRWLLMKLRSISTFSSPARRVLTTDEVLEKQRLSSARCLRSFVVGVRLLGMQLNESVGVVSFAEHRQEFC